MTPGVNVAGPRRNLMTGAQAAGRAPAAKRTASRPRPSRRCRPTAGMPRRASATPSWWPGTSGAPSRIAFHYLRDAAEADEAVQDAFVKAYSHLSSFREELPFEVWFTRILINGCLDRIKARTRRERWLVSMPGGPGGERDFAERMAGGGPSPEDQLLARERRQQLAASARQAARAAALGVHAEPLRRLHVARSERADRAERVDGAGASVPRDPEAANAARRRRRTPEDRERNAVSILNRLGATGHLDDAALAAIWTDASTDGARPTHPHLDVLRRAAAPRFASFAAGSTTSATDAVAEADEVFPPERLAAQQAQIFRRLEAARAAGARHRVPALRAAAAASTSARPALDRRGGRRRPDRRRRRRPDVHGPRPPSNALPCRRRAPRSRRRHAPRRIAVQRSSIASVDEELMSADRCDAWRDAAHAGLAGASTR